MGQQKQHGLLQFIAASACLRKKTRNIVAVNEIHLRRLNRLLIAHEKVRNPLSKLQGCQSSVGDCINNGERQIVVHRGIELISFQKRSCIVPNFPNQYCISLDRPNGFSELPPKVVIDLIGNIQPPSVNIKLLNPVGANLQKIPSCLRVSRV